LIHGFRQMYSILSTATTRNSYSCLTANGLLVVDSSEDNCPEDDISTVDLAFRNIDSPAEEDLEDIIEDRTDPWHQDSRGIVYVYFGWGR